MLDCLIKNGTVVDGTGQKPFIADIGIQGGRITHIGHINEAAKEVMDAEAAKNANFKKIYDHYRKFQAQQNQWYSVAESRMQNYLMNATSGGNKS